MKRLRLCLGPVFNLCLGGKPVYSRHLPILSVSSAICLLHCPAISSLQRLCNFALRFGFLERSAKRAPETSKHLHLHSPLQAHCRIDYTQKCRYKEINAITNLSENSRERRFSREKSKRLTKLGWEVSSCLAVQIFSCKWGFQSRWTL